MLENLCDDDDENERPQGCKAAKSDIKLAKTNSEYAKESLVAKKTIAAATIERNVLLAEQNEIGLFSIVPVPGDGRGAIPAA